MPQLATPQHQLFIRQSSVSDLLADKKNVMPLVDLSETATIEEAFDRLLSENVLSLPIYRLEKLETESQRTMVGQSTTDTNALNSTRQTKLTEPDDKLYIGIVSTYDLLQYLVHQLPLLADSDLAIDTSSSVIERGRILHRPVSEAVGMTSEGRSILTVQTEDSLISLLDALTTSNRHRALVLSSNRENSQITHHPTLPSIITQTDLARYFVQNLHQLGSVLDTTLEDVMAHRKEPHRVHTISSQVTAWQALKTLSQSNSGALAIVDDAGSMLAEFSAAEIRGLNTARLEEFHRPILVYIRERAGGLLARPFFCRPQFTLSQCMAGMVRLGVRRAWLVNGEQVPEQMVTLTDVLLALRTDTIIRDEF